MPDVRLVDLEIIKRFSLAVRHEYADADEILEALARTDEYVRKEAGLDKPAAKRTSGRKKAPAKASLKRSSGSSRSTRSRS